MSLIDDSPIPKNPVVPNLKDGDTKLSFRCYKGIKCWNACCANIDISLTPYDIIRLKNRLGMKSWDFLREYTVPYEMEKDGIAGVKFRPVENGTACQFMRDEGCSVYEDRPTACRYYPVGLVSMRREDEYTDRQHYAIVSEKHCLGHEEDNEMTIDEYRKEQGVEEYDEHSRGWRQLILKKMSSGPTIGKPSLRSRQLFFTGCYDIDRFREFVRSEGFKSSFDIDESLYAKLLKDDVELLEFAFRFLKQVMFGEVSIPVRESAVEERMKKYQQQAEEKAAESPENRYDPSSEPVDL